MAQPTARRQPSRAPRETHVPEMMTRTTAATVTGRATAMRRLRRRASQAVPRPYCRTNGCASFLELDPVRGVATCPVCGYTRTLH